MEKNVLIISEIAGSGWFLGKAVGSQAFPKTVMAYGNAGWKVFLLAGHSRLGLKKEYNITPNIKVNHFSKKIWRIRKFFLKARPFFLFRSLWWFFYEIIIFFKAFFITRKEKFDLFYGYEIHGIFAAKLLSLVFKKPVIFRYQGTKIPLYKKQKLWQIRHFPHILAMKLRGDLYIMTNDGTTGEDVLLGYGVPKEKIRFWTNGIDDEIFKILENSAEIKKSLGFDKNDKILTSISRLEKWKRIDRTICALPKVVRKYPNTYFLIIGWGEEKENLENLAKKLKIEKNIKFIGSVPHKELRKYYSITDIFISMYDISNVGNPLLEAMAQGKCIITLDVGDTKKFIKNEKNGIIINKEKISSLSSIIISLLEDKKKRNELGKNARDFAKKKLWTWEERMKAEIKEANKLVLKWQKK